MSNRASSPCAALKATLSVSVSISLGALIALARGLRMHQQCSFCSPRQIELSICPLIMFSVLRHAGCVPRLKCFLSLYMCAALKGRRVDVSLSLVTG